MNRQVIIKSAIIILLVVIITALHYLTSTTLHQFHDIYRRLYYIPIILGGLWFTLGGGLSTAVLVSIVYAPHVLFQWQHWPGTELEQYLEILLYNVIGLLTGLLSQREQRQKKRYQKTSEQLEKSYDKLRHQADELLEIEEQLRRADRLSALGELSAGMAHEIRNPLGSIRGTAEIIRDGIDKKDKRYEFAEILVKEVDRLDGVVRDFLNFARPSAVGQSSVPICEALTEVVTLTRQQAIKNNVEINLAPVTRPALVAGDLEHYKQAFLNLVLNALQVMPDGGKIDISCAETGESLKIFFNDSGPGIPVELHDRIFNPFYTTRSDGTGLGLAITHRIIDSNGGKLSVESLPGRGATFIVELPLWKGREA
ncbi:MAG: sensor histidine kinase [Desulfuromonas sp.]|nr:MAG: sensor histidine kinase [Desulfuromonas sp.]